MYSAELKLPVSTSRAAKAARVDAVLEHLALSSCRDVRIGCVLARGISGGQAKRVNIGLSLLSRPRVLFLDEPTSGLDSYSANECMGVIKALTRGGITVCATIHSPTPYAFDLFDRLHLLLRGRTAFLGDNGPSVIRFFQAVFPTAPPCDEGGGAGGGGGRGGAAGLSSYGGGSGAWSGAAADWWAEDEEGGGAKKAGPPGRTASSVSSLLVTALSGVSAAAGGGATPTGGLSPAASGPLPPPHPARQPLAPPPPPSAFHNRAEWVVDLTTRADRDGRAGECAAAYVTSRLAATNAARVHRLLTERSPVSETVRRELGATQATTTPAWWGVRTMLAYRTSRDYMDLDFLGPRVIDRALLSVIITTLYWKVGGNASPGNGEAGKRGRGGHARARARQSNNIPPSSLSLSLTLSRPCFLVCLSSPSHSLQHHRPPLPVGHHAGLLVVRLHALPVPGAGPVHPGAGGRPVPANHGPGVQDGVGAHDRGPDLHACVHPRLLRMQAGRVAGRLCGRPLRDERCRREPGVRHRRPGAVDGRRQCGPPRLRLNPTVSCTAWVRFFSGGGALRASE